MAKFNQFNNERSEKRTSGNTSFIKPVNTIELESGANKKEIINSLNKMNKLKGDKKEEYIAELVSKNNSLAFATDLLRVLDSIITYNHKLDQDIVKGYQETIKTLLKRLEKLKGQEDKFEIELIYKEVDKLNNNIQSIHDDWQDILKILLLGVFSLVGIVVGNKYKKQ
ncbi:hypothetical protein SAMN04487975_101374 [Planococcus glaciei]|uniref:hypothetical protein n=1 Tax=Planococcus glaciei TaxID=459472 RepID=UPI00088C3254|nr:hypothetical protein [Planococcus glaciei]SDG74902.1 hypothetical protein SAMN04487975_101374 [Planococcus glaciei]